MSNSVAERFPRWIAIIAASALAASAAVINHAPAQAAATLTEVAVPTPNSVPEGITLGPDGNLWFTEFQGGKIGRITPTGTITEFSGLTGAPFWITAGPIGNGNLWFTENSNAVGEMTTAGVLVGEFPLPVGGSGLDQIAAGSDGNLWITEYNGNRIGKVSTAGVVTDIPTPLSSGAGPTAIVGGPDGSLWFTEQSASKIGRITTAGVVTEFGGLSANSTPAGIAVGPDGNLWFTEFDGNRIGRITLDGTVSEFAVPTANSQPGSLAAGPDGNVWFTEQNGNKIGRMSPAGVMLDEFPVPTPFSGPGAIAAGPDQALWFTERLTNQIGRVALPTVSASTTLTYTGATSGDFNDPATVSATLVDSSVTPSVPLAAQSVSFSLNGTDTCSGVTDAAGVALCALTPTAQSGTYSLVATFAGAGALPGSSTSVSFVVKAEESAMAFVSSVLLANGLPAQLAAALTEDGKKPIPGRQVALTLGSGAAAQTCSSATAADGSARCSIDPINQALGPGQASASFAGDGFYMPASTTANALVFAYATGGSFVAGDGSAGLGASTTFWADTWATQNTLSGGQGPASFKGFANAPSSTPPVCGGTWTSDPGNSSGPPPAPLPGYMAVVVSSSASKSGSTVSGNITKMVIVKTDAGYAPDPQSHGTGTVVAVLC